MVASADVLTCELGCSDGEELGCDDGLSDG